MTNVARKAKIPREEQNKNIFETGLLLESKNILPQVNLPGPYTKGEKYHL